MIVQPWGINGGLALLRILYPGVGGWLRQTLVYEWRLREVIYFVAIDVHENIQESIAT